MNVLITGSSGLVATQLTIELLQKTDYRLILLSTNVATIENRYEDRYKDRVVCCTMESLSEILESCDVDVCIHTAFARSSDGKQIVSSVEYTIELLTLLRRTKIKRIVNVSSQGLYGKNQENLCKETSAINPDYMYALGKYCNEAVFRLMLEGTNIKWTSIRLASVCENARFMNVFVKNALEGKPIHLTAGNQICSFIDVRDVASALMSVVENENVSLEHLYNLGTGETYTIRSIAETVREIGNQRYGTHVEITDAPNANTTKVGMDNSKFVQTFGWYPRYSIEDMVNSLFEMHVNPDGGGYPTAFKIVYGI